MIHSGKSEWEGKPNIQTYRSKFDVELHNKQLKGSATNGISIRHELPAHAKYHITGVNLASEGKGLVYSIYREPSS